MALKSVNLQIDGQWVVADSDQNLLEICLSARRNLPYFCWHPALGSVGACRQCAITVHRDEHDIAGQIVMACMTPVTDGMIISLETAESRMFREATLELVLTNHPHDCPVCEVGGDCHLQDMTVMTGHSTRRFDFPKRTHLNQDLGPFIKHEMNRCIGCYRCVRFYRDYAGGDDFGVFGAARNVYFGRANAGPLESEFAGNLVEICPTGVFVDKPYAARFARKWDMRATPSICPHCAVGCNITINEREGEFRRVTNRFNPTINGYFLCDRGRFGVGFVESPALPSRARGGDDETESRVVTDQQAIGALTDILRSGKLIGVGSPRATIESNFALLSLVGPENFYAGVTQQDWDIATTASSIIDDHRVPIASIAEVEHADCIVVIGDDPADIAPRLALAIQQAARAGRANSANPAQIPAWHADARKTAAIEGTSSLYLATILPSRLDKFAASWIRASGDALQALCIDVSRVINGDDQNNHPTSSAFATEMISALRAARSPVIIVGGSSCGAQILAAAANCVVGLRAANSNAKLVMLLPEANSLGLALLRPRAPDDLTRDSTGASDRHCIVIESDLMLNLPPHQWHLLRQSMSRVAVLDHIETTTTQQADLVVACGNFTQGSGTIINAEGRAQQWHKAIYTAEARPVGWQILRDCAIDAGVIPPMAWQTRSDLLEALAAYRPCFNKCHAPSACASSQPFASPTLPVRYSGRTAVNAGIDVREPVPPLSPDPAWSATMEGGRLHPDVGAASHFWAPGWNSAQSVNQFQTSVGGPLISADQSTLLFEHSEPPTPIECPSGARIETGNLIFVRIAPVFGGEVLSAHSPAIKARMIEPFVLINASLARQLALTDGTMALCSIGEHAVSRRVIIASTMADGYCGIVTGLPGEASFPLPCAGMISPACGDCAP